MRLVPAVLALAGSILLTAVPAAAAPGAPLPVDGDALLRTWVAPVLPPEVAFVVAEQKIVRLRCIIDAQGNVRSARVLRLVDPRLAPAALAAVKAWHFSPALRAGKPVACCLDVPVVFSATPETQHALLPPMAEAIKAAPFTEAEATQMPDAEYPDSLSGRGLPGQVQLSWGVTAEGRVIQPRVVQASHPDFVLPALAALASWEFKPAHQGDLAVPTELSGAVDFAAPNLSRSEILKANELTAPDGSEPADEPVIRRAPDPVYPYDALIASVSGEATVQFTVTNRGRVEDLEVRSATRPEFGLALAAALATWQFEPANRDGQYVPVTLLKHQTFTAPTIGGDPPDPVATLVQAVRNHAISRATGLDEGLRPVYQVLPAYPTELRAAGNPAGEALLELTIARDGRVRLTRIVSATQSAFGWAAATAFSQWIFAPPRRHGQPVDTVVQAPVRFDAQH